MILSVSILSPQPSIIPRHDVLFMKSAFRPLARFIPSKEGVQGMSWLTFVIPMCIISCYCYGNIVMEREIHGESSVWSTAQGWKKGWWLDVCVGFEWNNISVGYGKQCVSVQACIEEGGCLVKGIIVWGWRSKEEEEVNKDLEEAGWVIKLNGCLEQGKCALWIKIDCWSKSDCHHVEVNPATHCCCR